MKISTADMGGKPSLIIGGTGKTGRRVAQRLTAKERPVRVGSRAGSPPFDWHDKNSWGPALDGVRAAYITYYPDITVPGAVEAIETFIDIALARRVQRLVLLSGRGEKEAQHAEQVLIGSGADWTVVRASWFMQNFSENFFVDSIQAGEVLFPADKVTEPFVDVDDIADVVTEALVGGDEHLGQIYEVTGPRLMTFHEAVTEIGHATERQIGYSPVSAEDFLATLRQQDVPANYIALLEYLTCEVLDGRNESLANGVQRALGRPPRDFSDYARDAAATGVWKGQM